MAVALVAAASADRSGAKTLRTLAGCGPVLYDRVGVPDVVVAVDLPLQGADRFQSKQMADAVEFMIDRAEWRAGSLSVGLRVCDNASAARGAWDENACAANARRHAADGKIVAVIGPYNSGCAAIMIPVLNETGLLILSPGNTYPCLTERVAVCEPGEPAKYYPYGTRNYARTVASDDTQATALLMRAASSGHRRVFVLHDRELYGLQVAAAARRAAPSVGVRVSGYEGWSRATSSYGPLMERVRRSGANALLIGGVASNGGARLLREKLRVLGPNARFPVFASDGFVLASLFDEAGATAIEGMIGSAPTLPPLRLRPRAVSLGEAVCALVVRQPKRRRGLYAASDAGSGGRACRACTLGRVAVRCP